jgi:uncharacterized protein (TIGR02145 family)
MFRLIVVVTLFFSFLRNTASQSIPILKSDNEIWLLENLNVSTFRNGDPIPEAKTAEEWKIAGEKKQPAWCYYSDGASSNTIENGKEYPLFREFSDFGWHLGKLYNWYALQDQRGIAPEGWQIPDKGAWEKLIAEFDGGAACADRILSILGNKGRVTLASGFRSKDGEFKNVDNYAHWWTKSNVDEMNASSCIFDFESSFVYSETGIKAEGYAILLFRNIESDADRIRDLKKKDLASHLVNLEAALESLSKANLDKKRVLLDCENDCLASIDELESLQIDLQQQIEQNSSLDLGLQSLKYEITTLEEELNRIVGVSDSLSVVIREQKEQRELLNESENMEFVKSAKIDEFLSERNCLCRKPWVYEGAIDSRMKFNEDGSYEGWTESYNLITRGTYEFTDRNTIIIKLNYNSEGWTHLKNVFDVKFSNCKSLLNGETKYSQQK